MSLKRLIIDSAKELIRRPQFFVPKLTTSFLSSIWVLMVLIALENQDMALAYTGIGLFPIIFFLGVYSPVLVAEMVKKEVGLLDSIKTSFNYLGRILGASLLLLIGMIFVVTPFYFGLGLFLLNQSILPLIIGAFISILALLVFSFLAYFLPIALTSKGLINSFKDSYNTSAKNKKEVVLLVLFSFSLLGVAALTSGVVRGLGIAGFILGRAFSSVVATYTVIISPKYYLET